MATWQIYKGVVCQGRILLTPPVDLPEGREVYVVVMGESAEETAVTEFDERRQLAIAAVEEYIRRSSSSSASSV